MSFFAQLQADPYRSQAGQLGQALGLGINKNFPDPQMLVQREMLQKSLNEAKQSIRQPGATPLDKMFSFMQAGAGIPGSERYMGALLPLVQQLTQAEAAQNAPLGVGNETTNQPSNQPTINNVENELNSFLEAPKQEGFYPSNVGDQQSIGNLPQAATSGVKQPIATNQQLLRWAKPYAKQRTQAGIPTRPEEAYEQLKAINADNIEANKLIEGERKERVTSQRDYGNIAAQKLSKVLPNAGDEETAYIKKQMEQFAGQNKSEADIERLASGEVRKYKNMLSKVSNDLPASRSYNRPFRNLLGTSKSDESARNDLKVKVQPLLNAGLYDKARLLLAEKGYYPEERELIVSNGIGEIASKEINKLPKLSSNVNQALEDGYYPEQINDFKDNLKEVLTKDPASNLLLLRRQYEFDKGVTWRLFKDSLNELIDEGVFKPNDDQFNMLNTLDQPPLSELGKILHGIGIIGR